MKPRRVILWLVLAPLVVVAGLLSALWVWTNTDTSLASALQQASRYLPAGQTLIAEEVQGSLRRGGRIGRLRWESNGLVVEARQIALAWQPAALLQRRLQLDTLHIAQLSIDDQSPAAATPPPPPQSVVLPFQVGLAFAIDALRWNGSPALQASGLSGRYRFDGSRHELSVDTVQVAAGQYRAQASLLARAPLTLALQVHGTLTAPVPGSTQALPLVADASAHGQLAGPDTLLNVQALLQPVPSAPPPAAGSTASPAMQAMEATVSAQINPWAAQPVARAEATFSQLNLAVLWPEAPQTLLTGNVQVQPDGNGWQGQGRIANRLSGPWDKGRLPLDGAQGQVRFDAGQWRIESLTAELAGGRLQVQGQFAGSGTAGAAPGWQGRAQLQNINPAALYASLAAARLDGKLDARAVGQAIAFDAQLQPSGKQPAASRLKGLHLRAASARGQWADGTLHLQALKVQTDDALLQGQVDVHLASKASRGQLHLSLPGGQADITGHLSAQAGAGDFALHLADAGKASRWLAKLPGLPPSASTTSVQGQGELTGRWQGGWQHQGTQLALQAALRVPRMDLRTHDQTPEQALHLGELNADLTGRLGALDLHASGELQTGTRRFNLQTQVRGGRGIHGDWQARIRSATLQAQDSPQPGHWTVQLREPLAIGWTPGSGAGTLRAGAGEATLSSPLPGAATLSWQPVRWRVDGPRSELQTQGQLRALPLAWLDLLGNEPLGKLGLRGTMLLDGDWYLQASDTLKLRASLVRRSGDIRVQADENATPQASTSALQGIDAGVRQASITVTADGNALQGALRWDSERAGRVQADFATRLSRGNARADGGWRWRADAPVTGSVRAQLPQIGVWSVLAPPGWRVRGTLDANVTLSGTRASPQWRGTLTADDLALRSVVDGIEFSHGKLRASFTGQRMDIQEFSLQGASAGSSSGGQLTLKGFAEWLPDSAAVKTSLSKVRMTLQAQAQSLRVMSRADRRLTVSGALQARLSDATLEIRGALKADQALFVVPDDTAPRLGDDVAVKSAIKSPAQGAARGPDRSAAPPAATAPGSRLATDVAVTLDLGGDFRVQSRGLDTRLAGTLQLASAGNTQAPPRLTGEVRTVRGSYKAYGQQLDIEEGVLRFTGPYDNPALDILAIRPNLTVRVGVQISGTALSPHIRLYADPDLPDAEKLAWLVLGHSGAEGGAETVMLQQAALALLGGNGKGLSGGLAQSLGLDELSFRGAASNADGSTSAAAVTLGKRLSRGFYVAYERSLAGALGTFSIFYDLSRRFTLRAQTGDQSAIDLIFTVPYD
ncbi:MAG: translocation/assembly module TamB domain-containing protein [Rhodoferax sp.]|nr:translocation/assembly module TamB domain-containing protein [Rhodoferax sp.]